MLKVGQYAQPAQCAVARLVTVVVTGDVTDSGLEFGDESLDGLDGQLLEDVMSREC
ncbi:hypothetical protein [Streptomyces sp. VRA16 Mangrove soil]|uniref:hypothetical protein n=1 Tax=Streptomyces sp. VRA16 Mangrove soil TaxID=2817434 RepID=UPI001A9F8527|nr:hypothetical protein [Streptomyces sp. VRA16 Mangrove soil]MBO1330406.1 hypothetical protein [Streptomyces sp. VRA16 Mangrove soil]